jgi:UDPglucose 6-dehydrogenase
MDPRSAEMAKHASNAFLAASVSFANELAALCEAAGADVDAVTRVMKLDRRIGPLAFLSAGMGFAGGTLGRDVRSLQQAGRDAGVATPLLDAVMTVNEGRAALVVERLRSACGDVRGLRVGVWGLTYKAGTSTLRRSVALRVVEDLTASGAEVRAFDPWADFGGAGDVPDFALCESALEAADGADAVVLLTEWPELAEVDPDELRRRMRRPLLLDTRNFLNAAALAAAGVTCLGIGRPVPAAGPGRVAVGGAA